MSEDEDPAEERTEATPDETEEIDQESLDARLDGVEDDIDAAETEDDFDDVEATLDEIEVDIEAADLPEPDDEEDDPREELESRLSDLRDDVDDQRGPYAEDVVTEIESAESTIDGTEWTDQGHVEVATAVDEFLETVGEILDRQFKQGQETITAQFTAEGEAHEILEALDDVIDAIEGLDLDPDADADTIAELLEATDALANDLDDAEEWDDLTVREKLAAHGFYDVLDHRKDYPPEWHCLKVFEKRGDAEMVLLALDLLDSNYMEEHCIDALKRLGDERALDEMTERAQKRDKPAIEVLGKIGSEEPVEMLLEYAEADGDPGLQFVTLKALGEIGSEEATRTVADRLVSDNDDVRSRAARALGLIGDTRAIDPLADVLDDDDADGVRASAAWALNQIGTERAREAVQQYTDDRAYLVQAEAEKADDARTGTAV